MESKYKLTCIKEALKQPLFNFPLGTYFHQKVVSKLSREIVVLR